MIQFDKATLIRWQEQNVSLVSLEFISRGCEGTEIVVSPWLKKETFQEFQGKSEIPLYINPKDAAIFDTHDFYFTYANGKWITKSSAILTRCGCGKSFSFSTGDVKIDKLKLLKSKLKETQGKHHA